MPISPDDTVGIQHINHVSNLIHDYADTLYEGLMDMEYDDVREEGGGSGFESLWDHN